MRSENFIRVYDNVLDENFCSSLINRYEQVLVTDADKVKNLSLCYDKAGNKLCDLCNCTRMNTMEHDAFSHDNKILIKAFYSSIKDYIRDCKITSGMIDPNPDNWGWEEFKIHRSFCGDGSSNDDQFKTHVDVRSHAAAKRYLIAMLYLNDNFSEGNTEFPLFDIKVKPKTGSIILIPPLWTHLHRAEPPLDGYAKYICMTYLNYPDITQVDYSKNPLLGESYMEGHSSMAAKTTGQT